MNEKRFKSVIDEDTMSIMPYLVSDKEEECFYNLEGCVDLLNEQQDTIRKLQDLCGQSDYENAKLRQEIKELKAQLREKEEDERLYANEIVKLNKEAKEVLDFKNLGGDY